MDRSQVYALAVSAGFPADTARTMTAIAQAESGLDPNAVGDTTITSAKWGPSIGLWQIRSLNADRGTGRPRDASRLTDPAFNARAALSVYREQGLSAWSVYTSGKYRQYLQGSDSMSMLDTIGDPQSAPGLVAGQAVGGAIAGAAGAVREAASDPFGLSGVVDRWAPWLVDRARWAGVTYVVFVAGVLMCLVGVVIILRGPIASGVKAVASRGTSIPGDVGKLAEKVK